LICAPCHNSCRRIARTARFANRAVSWNPLIIPVLADSLRE